MLSLWFLCMFQCDCDKTCSLYYSSLVVVFFSPFWKTMHACITVCLNCWQGCDDFFFSLSSASAKAAPLNINKVSNSLLNFGRKLIAPAMASGSAVGPPASGGSFPAPAVAIRSTAEAPQYHHHHHQQHHHHHQAQQQRMMKSESMPVQLGKGNAETRDNAITGGSVVMCLKDWRKSFYWFSINGFTSGGNKKGRILLSRMFAV